MARRLPCTVAAALLLGVVASGCAAPESRGERQIHYGEKGSQFSGKVTQAELQQDVERFASVFMDRVGQVVEDLRTSKDITVRDEIYRRVLLSASSALEIASEPFPDLALLDMLVFITLSKQALEEHWIPTVFHEKGAGLQVAFERSEPEIWAIASKVMSPPLQERLRQLVARWKNENPGQYRVEGVRFGDFSKKAGKIAEERAGASGGLLAAVDSGIQAADEVVLTANRALYLAQRYPSLLRLSAVVVAGDVLSEVGAKFEPGGPFSGTLQNAYSLTQSTARAAREGRMLAESLYPLILPNQHRLSQQLESANALAAKLLSLVGGVNATAPEALVGFNRLALRIFIYCCAFAMVFAAAWWGAYYFVRTRLDKVSRDSTQRKKAA